jgi:hypothetical protein
LTKTRIVVIATTLGLLGAAFYANSQYQQSQERNSVEQFEADAETQRDRQQQADALARAALDSCTEAWNSPENDQMRILLGHYGGGGGGTPYISVGYAVNYPDRCLITASNPQFGAVAIQFLETPSTYGTFTILAQSVPLSSLDAVTTSWNASSDNAGYISLTP